MFIITAEIYLFGACIYTVLGDGKKQWWADGVRHEGRWSLRPLSSNTDFYKKEFPGDTLTGIAKKGKEEDAEESSNAHNIQN